MSQKALLLKTAKSPLVLVDDHPTPKPGDHEIQVKVDVAGLNSHDQKTRDEGLFLDIVGLPAVLANDVVGTVVAVGNSVSSFKIGDRVVSQADFSSGTTQNGLQEYALLYEEFSSRVPDSISSDEAATLPTNILATLVALFHDLPIPAPWTEQAKAFDYKNSTLLIVGGGSFAGQFAVQLAKLAGINRIVVVGGAEAKLKRYGATHVLDRHAPQDVLLERIRDVVGDELVYAYDPVNMPDGQLLALNALSSHKKGYFARLLPMPLDESKVLGKKAGFEVGNVFGISTQHPELCREFWKRLPEYLEQGLIIPIEGDFEITEDLNADKVNNILDTFKEGGKLKHAHVHL